MYFAPPPESPLAAFGRLWLGRDDAGGASSGALRLDGLDPRRLEAIVGGPRRYGFHATLKAPFVLAPGISSELVHGATAGLACDLAPFDAPPLALRALDGFLALVPSAPSPALGALAAECVRRLDRFRAPVSDAERARRRPHALTPRQRQHLEHWGYPWVMEDFRFHITLTTRLEPDERRRVAAALAPLVAPFTDAPLRVDAICVFEEPRVDARFVLAARYPLTSEAAADFTIPSSIRNLARRS